MLQDEINIKIEAGSGGRGSNAMYSNRPAGGDGGKGGDVYLKGSINTYDLSFFDSEKTYKAQNGGAGQQKSQRGENAQDLVLLVPLTTEVRLNGKLIGKIEENGQTMKILSGGVGGYGNNTLMRNRNLRLNENERQGEKGYFNLILKLKSDIIFIGYPNAGKSSLLNELTNAHVKTAPYQFTTLEPQLGLMDSIVLMDLPGLIEGTYEGKGLGTSFVKHTENCKLIVHFVSMENENPYESYLSMREEIKNISIDMYNKPEIVVLTKTDLVSEEQLEREKAVFEKNGIYTVETTIIDPQSLTALKNKFKKLLA